jgi:hypothetical protein
MVFFEHGDRLVDSYCLSITLIFLHQVLGANEFPSTLTYPDFDGVVASVVVI